VIRRRLDLDDPALDRIDHLPAEPDEILDLWELLSGLTPLSGGKVPALMGDADVAGHDQLWIHLPSALFPDGGFASLAVAEAIRDGFDRRLRISVSCDSSSGQPLFVRLIDPTTDPLRIIAIDALQIEQDAYQTTMDVPAGFDFDQTRVEVVANLDLPLLDDAAHAGQRGRQWAILALAAERSGSADRAVRFWRLAERLHQVAGQPRLSDEAAERARSAASGTRPEPFLAESSEAASIEENRE
jgi:hypothetical protein